MSENTVSEIESIKATQPGGLDGYQASCSCGLVMKNSLHQALVNDINDHLAWHAKQMID